MSKTGPQYTPLLLLFWLALANDLEAHAGGAQAGSSQVIGLG